MDKTGTWLEQQSTQGEGDGKQNLEIIQEERVSFDQQHGDSRHKGKEH